MATLRYRTGSGVDDLELGECTMHGAETSDGRHFWHLWFRVNRDSDGQDDTFCVPMNPNGPFLESGPGGKTWGLTRADDGDWQVSPSINVLDTRELHPGEHEAPSLWHQTPKIVNVPAIERWITDVP